MRVPETVFSPCVVIPVYDHEHAIAAVVQQVRAQRLPVLLVDDGCGESCAQRLQQLGALPGVVLLRHARNEGKGAAVCTGLRAAAMAGYTHAVQVDADGQHALCDLGRFVEEARAHPEAVICGRPVFDASIPKVRFYGRYLTHVLVWLETLSFQLIDTMCGFRVYPLAPTLELLGGRRLGARMDFDTEVLVRLHWRDVPMRWVPTRVSYPLDGISHFRLVLDNALLTGLHARLLFGMLARLPLLLWRKAARAGGLRPARKRGASA